MKMITKRTTPAIATAVFRELNHNQDFKGQTNENYGAGDQCHAGGGWGQILIFFMF